MKPTFPCYMVRKGQDDSIAAGLEEIGLDDLPSGDVVIRVAYSSLNYKDALAATGHPGVARRLPHVPGIDAAGTVASSDSESFSVGQEVLVTGYSLGETRFGGWAGYVRMPAENVVPLPEGLTLFESMALGTAGFTAAQAVLAIQERCIDPGRGPVVVTGATGGVGSYAVALLSRAGFEVVAVTGKADAESYLRELGASRIASRDEVQDTSNKPLLAARWSSAIDTTGGNILGTILRSTDHRGVVAACGLVAGTAIPMTVYPFLLRGVNLVGIDSAQCPMDQRQNLWARLAGEWKLENLLSISHTVSLDQLGEYVPEILAGRVQGRIVVAM